MLSMNRHLMASAATVGLVLGSAVAAQAEGEAMCSKEVHILAQPRDGLTTTEKYADEFKKLSGAGFQIDYLNENDRRAKSRADASTVGRYNVYYVDEANLAQFASSNWIVPLLKYYPEKYDFKDFDPGRRETATFDGKVWFAPIQGGGDLLVYRTDIFKAAGLEPPKTVDEMVADAKKLNDPDKGIYGIALRGQRGSGANVWRWMTYFRGYGGEWFDKDGKPAFDSPAAVKATETYLELFKYSPPGTKTGSWDEVTGAFNSGQVAMIVESAPLGSIALDPAVSSVTDKIAFSTPPTPLTGGGYAHGFAIAAKANPTEEDKKCAGLWIAWATDKKNEERRLEAGQAGELNRTSIFNSPEFSAKFGKELPAALAATAPFTKVNFWQNAKWPELGDRWGIILEELITGQRTDIKAALDELNDYALTLTSN